MKKILLAGCLLAVLALTGCEQPDSGPSGLPTVAELKADVPAGSTVPDGTQVTLSTAEVGAVIRYTLDGSAPNSDSEASEEDEPITISAEDADVDGKVTITAVAVKQGYSPSYLTVEYTVSADAVAIPLPSETARTVAADTGVTLAVAGGATIRYTTDPAVDLTADTGTEYDGETPIEITGDAGATVTLKVIAVGTPDGEDPAPVSAVRTITYTIASYTWELDHDEDNNALTITVTGTGADTLSLTAADISVSPEGFVGEYTQPVKSGTVWSLPLILPHEDGDVTVRIRKARVESAGKTVTLEAKDLTTYTAEADGSPKVGATDGVTSTTITFAFSEAVTGLTKGNVALTAGTGSAGIGDGDFAASGDNITWTLPITVTTAGNVTVAITGRDDIESGGKPVTVFKADEETEIGYTATANGAAGRVTSTAIALNFGAAVPDLTADDIDVGVEGDSGSVTKSALTGGGQNYSLAITVTTAGTVTVSIDKTGIESATKTVTVHKDTTAAADVSALSATAGSTEVTLNWTNPADADFDHVEISWKTGEDEYNTPVSAGKATAYKVTGLDNNIEYTFLVKTVDTAGNKSDGVTDLATPAAIHDNTAPGPVTELRLTPGNAKVTLEWTDPVDADLDHVEISWKIGTGDYTEPVEIENGEEAYTATNLTNGTAYTFLVKTVDTAGNAGGGVTETNTVATYNATQSGGISLKKYSTAITLGVAVQDLSAGELTVADDTGKISSGSLTGSSGNYSVPITVSEAGNVNVTINRVDVESATKSVAVYTDTTVPGPVANLNAVAGTGQAVLTWTDPTDTDSDIDNIRIAWDGGSGSVNLGTETYTATGLTNGTEYTFTVTVADKNGNTSAPATTSPVKPLITYTAEEYGGAATVEDSEGIVFTFSAPVADLTVGDITVAIGTGNVDGGGLTGNVTGTIWTLELTGVTTAGDVSVSINRTGIDDTEHNVTAHRKTTGLVTVEFTAPEDEAINLTGVETLYYKTDDTLTATVTGQYESYSWELDGKKIEDGDGDENDSSLTLKARAIGVKQHILTVFVTTADGVTYTKSVTFVVAFAAPSEEE